MTRSTYLSLALLLAALAPSAARAHEGGPTEREAIEIADRWAASQAPGHVNHCAGGARAVVRSDELIAAETERNPPRQGVLTGYADGWVLVNNRFVWDHTRCSWVTRAYTGHHAARQRCADDAHEMMHYVIGPEHVGPLDPRHEGPRECWTHRSHRPKSRTVEQIKRSMLFQRRVAKIRARRVARRMRGAAR